MPMWGVAARSLRFCAERHASAARQTGDKFAYANLMTGWWVGCIRLLGGDVQEPYTDRPTLCR
jgi:hypothetical protein